MSQLNLKSYKFIQPTESIPKIEATKEFVEYKRELAKLVNEKKIELNDMAPRLAVLRDTIKKYMHNKMRKNKKSVIKKIKEIESTKTMFKNVYRQQVSDCDPDETYLFKSNEVIITLPNSTYYDRIFRNLTAKITFDLNDPKYNIIFYASIELSGSTVFHSFTTKTIIDKEITSKIEKEVTETIKKIPNYEATSMCYAGLVLCTLSINKWESIDYWWPNISSSIKFRKFKDFELFIASDRNSSCIKQCVEFLGEKYEENKDILLLLSNRKVVVYTPMLENMNYVQKFSDLLASYEEDIPTNDCKNVVRLIMHDGHIAVITKINEVYYRSKFQSKRRLHIKNSETTEVFMDIESLTQSIDEKNYVQIPYLICWSINDDQNVFSTSGKECLSDFIDKIMLLAMENKKIILYAWYGSGYDFQHILPALKEKSTSSKFIIKNSSIIFAEIYNKDLDAKIILKDPYLFLLTSLDKASKAFKVMNKGSFPHSIIKDWKDLDNVLENWVKVNQKIIVSKSDNKAGIIVKREEYLQYENSKNYLSVLEKAKEYCIIDVLAMRDVWLKFKNLVFLNIGMSLSDNTFTLSQLSMRLMEACLSPGVKLIVPSLSDYNFLKSAIYGGRVVVKNGIYLEDIIYADVVSLYPSAMKLLPHFYGSPKRVSEINENKMGVYNVILSHPDDSPPPNYLNFVPRRLENGKLSWKWFKSHQGTYHSYDLKIAKEEGFEIKCIEGIEYESYGYIFNKYIDKLYKLKDDHLNCDCDEKPCPIRMIAKIALNGGGYGKFVQKPIDREVYIVKRDIVANQIDSLKTNDEGKIYMGDALINKPYFYNLDGDKYDKMIIEKDENPVYSTQNGISILSASRYRLYSLCKKFKGIDIIYSDTDSLYIRKSTVDLEEFKKSCNTNLGSLDDTLDNSKNGIIHKMIIAGPKMYAYEYLNKDDDVEIKLYCKGVPKDMLNIEHLELLMSDKELAYEFNILRRRLVGIKTMDILKNITQT